MIIILQRHGTTSKQTRSQQKKEKEEEEERKMKFYGVAKGKDHYKKNIVGGKPNGRHRMKERERHKQRTRMQVEEEEIRNTHSSTRMRKPQQYYLLYSHVQ